MREILFRGKRIDNGEWVEGYYIFDKYDGTPRIVITNVYSTGTTFIGNAPRVDCETVGDYTGLTDKNGKRIFEGDILKVYETQEHAQNVSVSYENGQFVVSHYALKLLSDRVLQSEVIGNIHDNPELLEVEE